MYEQRKHLRRRTLLDGRIEVARLQGWAVDCAVRNVSGGGARVALHRRPTVPQHFQIGISGAAPKPARLVWYRDGHAGVAFVEAADRPAWDGICRRSPHQPAVAAAPCEVTVLQARIDAIAARRGMHDRRRAGHFTAP